MILKEQVTYIFVYVSSTAFIEAIMIMFLKLLAVLCSLFCLISAFVTIKISYCPLCLNLLISHSNIFT